MNSSLETQLGDELRQLASSPPCTPDLETIGRHARQRHRRGLAVRGTAGAGAALAAATAGGAVILPVTPAPVPAGPAGTAAHAVAPRSQLATLAAVVRASSAQQPADAWWLIIRTQTIGTRVPYVTYNLYTDSGAIYVADSPSELRWAIAHHQNLADGTQARQVAAARSAATGNLAAARLRMINVSRNYLGLGLSPAAQKRVREQGLAAERQIYREKGIRRQPALPTPKTIQEQADNLLWTNSVSALEEGGGSPQVRAGVLRLISTISGVAVADSVTGGQPTLTLTAGPEVFGGQGRQVLTISARTGMPVSSSVGDLGPGTPPSLETYKVSPTTRAGIESGRL
jgi:hypothetical protein